jgi:hypothetical protein
MTLTIVETVEKGFFARAPLPTASCCCIIPGQSAAPWRGVLYMSKRSQVYLCPSLGLTYVQPLSLSVLFLRRYPIMDDLFDIMHHTVEHPLNVHFDLSSQCKTISALLRPNVPKDWFHHGEPLAIDRSGFGRVYLRDHLV